MTNIYTALKNLVAICEKEAHEAGQMETPWLDEAREELKKAEAIIAKARQFGSSGALFRYILKRGDPL